jgi:glycosyltransferase involved in cell wall biosynthesis
LVRISVVIPTYHEDKIGECVQYLMQQTAWKKGIMEIIISDFFEKGLTYPNPTLDSLGAVVTILSVQVVNVDKRGIGYARHLGIMKARGDIIVNFDADSYFSTLDAIEQLCEPLMRGLAVISCCDSIFDTRNLTEEEIRSISMISSVLNHLNGMQRNPFFPPCLEAGMTFTKEAYQFVGGFSDVPQYEGFLLASKILHAYTPQMKAHIGTVQVVTSARRALASATKGLVTAYGNYGNAAYR